ncbi:MAG: acyl-CoA thioesterase [Rhodospirillum sp.]|nr:acyl-CoA thioesterase [Rhodospirillum sp.]MCF8489468.1 acyl-CoA thioesterase [Rhodospirillum sp.]MCF8500816.1 acyl-CoA thioesterase [Rhodospirillum sp.]
MPTENTDFIWRRRIGFGDCDPARIAYTGRIPDFALEAIDAFWEANLNGLNWYRMVMDEHYGMPIVHMEMDMSAPITPRHLLDCRVMPLRLGRTSIEFSVRGDQNGQVRFEARFVCVCVDNASFRKIPVPKAVRTCLEDRYPALKV